MLEHLIRLATLEGMHSDFMSSRSNDGQDTACLELFGGDQQLMLLVAGL